MRTPAFTGAMQCPNCKTVLGIDPTTTYCQCTVCKSNLNAKFSSAVLKMGVMKHPEVALCLGGKLGEPICKLELPEAQSLDR